MCAPMRSRVCSIPQGARERKGRRWRTTPSQQARVSVAQTYPKHAGLSLCPRAQRTGIGHVGGKRRPLSCAFTMPVHHSLRTRKLEKRFERHGSGKVRAWVENWGYGFIRPENSADDVFVHISALADGVDRLNFGAHLEFETGISPRNGKLRVVNVRVVG